MPVTLPSADTTPATVPDCESQSCAASTVIVPLKLLSLGVAESCTGGMVAERITNIPGSSDTFIGGGGPYPDVIKTPPLKGRPGTTAPHGAGSGGRGAGRGGGAQGLFSGDATLAVPGIAGPR